LSAIDQHGAVTCPECNHYFYVTQHQNEGASYARSWTEVPKTCRRVIIFWQIKFPHNPQVTKNEIWDKYLIEYPNATKE